MGNYPGFTWIGGFELYEKFSQHARSYGLEILQEEADAVEPGEQYHSVRLANGSKLNVHNLILATGQAPGP